MAPIDKREASAKIERGSKRVERTVRRGTKRAARVVDRTTKRAGQSVRRSTRRMRSKSDRMAYDRPVVESRIR